MAIPDHEMYGGIGGGKKIFDASDATAAPSTQSLVNKVPGQVTAFHRGLLNVGMRVRVGERTDLRVRWPLGSDMPPDLVPSLSITVLIPAEAVHLESGYFRLGKRRWNRWIGRIVLIETVHERLMVTVKLHNDPVTLKCCGSMTGSNWVPQVWDTVNIVVDPTQVSLDAGPRHDSLQDGSLARETVDSGQDARVWLRAQIIETVDASEGRLLSLLIGVARVSVLVGRDEDRFVRWSSGMNVEIHIGRYEAWLKPPGSRLPPVLCGILYLDQQAIGGAR